MESNGRMSTEGLIGKDLKGSSPDLTDVLSRHLTLRDEEDYENIRQDSRCPSLDSIRTPPTYKARILPLC
jgi:hypothetical protein